MRSPDKQQDRLQIPLMYAFRDAYEKRDAAKPEDLRIDGDRVISDRGSLRRRGADEALLKRDLSIDLGHLVDTIDLASSTDLSTLDYVRKSILNYGLYDLTHITIDIRTGPEVMRNLRSALLLHEPRISPESLAIEPIDSSDDVEQRIRFKVRAELICKPLDIPIEFLAEVDPASGKVHVAKPAGAA